MESIFPFSRSSWWVKRNIFSIKRVYCLVQECKLDACVQDLLGDTSFVAGKTTLTASKEFPPGNTIDPELYNKYVMVVDVDGHGYSKDFAHLLQANTPILRQVS